AEQLDPGVDAAHIHETPRLQLIPAVTVAIRLQRGLTVHAAHQVTPMRWRRDLLRRGFEVEHVERVLRLLEVALLERARQSGNEASAIGSIRAVHSGQTAYASSCAQGGYAQSNADLGKPPVGGLPFIGPDLEQADQPGHGKSGYLVVIADNADATNRDL